MTREDYRRQEGPRGQIRLPRPGDPDPFPTRFRRNTTVTPVEPMVAYWEAAQRRMDLFSYQRSDAWALVTAHVNTAAPPPVYPAEPRRVPVSHQLPARVPATPLITSVLIKGPAIKKAESDFVRRFRVAHSNNEAALDALIAGR